MTEYIEKLQAVYEKHQTDINPIAFFEKELGKEINFLQNEGFTIIFEDRQRFNWLSESDYILATFCELRKGSTSATGIEGCQNSVNKYSALINALKNFQKIN